MCDTKNNELGSIGKSHDALDSISYMLSLMSSNNDGKGIVMSPIKLRTTHNPIGAVGTMTIRFLDNSEIRPDTKLNHLVQSEEFGLKYEDKEDHEFDNKLLRIVSFNLAKKIYQVDRSCNVKIKLFNALILLNGVKHYLFKHEEDFESLRNQLRVNPNFNHKYDIKLLSYLRNLEEVYHICKSNSKYDELVNQDYTVQIDKLSSEDLYRLSRVLLEGQYVIDLSNQGCTSDEPIAHEWIITEINKIKYNLNMDEYFDYTLFNSERFTIRFTSGDDKLHSPYDHVDSTFKIILTEATKLNNDVSLVKDYVAEVVMTDLGKFVIKDTIKRH